MDCCANLLQAANPGRFEVPTAAKDHGEDAPVVTRRLHTDETPICAAQRAAAGDAGGGAPVCVVQRAAASPERAVAARAVASPERVVLVDAAALLPR